MSLNNPSVTTDLATIKLAVELDEVKRHNGVFNEADDQLLNDFIERAVPELEDYLGRSFISKTYEYVLDCFVPARGALDDFWYGHAPRGDRRGFGTIQLPRPPLVSITSINYIDQTGASQLLAATEYQVDTKRAPGRIAPSRTATTWPSTSVEDMNAVTIAYIAGYGAEPSNVDPRIRHLLCRVIGHWYENREQTSISQLLEDPEGQRLVSALKVVRF